jgi:hypothetical protein
MPETLQPHDVGSYTPPEKQKIKVDPAKYTEFLAYISSFSHGGIRNANERVDDGLRESFVRVTNTYSDKQIVDLVNSGETGWASKNRAVITEVARLVVERNLADIDFKN